jgi:hypothetical protein
VNKVERYTLLAAIAMHVGGLAVARAVPGVNLLSVDRSRELEAVEVDIEKETLPREDLPVADDEEPTDNRQAAAIDTAPMPDDRRDRRRRTAAPGTGNPDAEEPSGPGDIVDDGSEDGGDGEDWSTPEGEGWQPPGVGQNGPIYNDPSLFEMPQTGPAAPKKAPKGRKVDRNVANRVLKDKLREEDKKLGLDFPAGGTIASIFKAAVQGSDTPAEASASFAVALGPGGKVKSVTFLSASAGNESQWKAIAASVKGALASQKLAMNGDYAKGANVSVRVLSKMTMPSGAKPGAGLELSLTQKFDVADIGARPVRVVSASASATPVQ